MKNLKIEIPKGFEIESFDIKTGVVKWKKKKDNILERIKSFKDACDELGITMGLPTMTGGDPSEYRAMILNYKLRIIAKAINGDWTPDWDNSSESKYYPYFKRSSSGSGFSCYGFDYGGTYAYVGSRLCFKSEIEAKYFGEQFIMLHSELLSLK